MLMHHPGVSNACGRFSFSVVDWSRSSYPDAMTKTNHTPRSEKLIRYQLLKAREKTANFLDMWAGGVSAAGPRYRAALAEESLLEEELAIVLDEREVSL
jgi:hypothetical protein